MAEMLIQKTADNKIEIPIQGVSMDDAVRMAVCAVNAVMRVYAKNGHSQAEVAGLLVAMADMAAEAYRRNYGTEETDDSR